MLRSPRVSIGESDFRAPDKKIRETHRRESLVIGEVRGLGLGIIHYQMRSNEGTFRIYVTFSR